MSKGHRRSNREAKKPKQAKPKAPVAGAILAPAQSRPETAAREKKKR